MAILLNNRLQVTIFGQSHGKAIGVTICGLPSGINLDNSCIESKLAARKAKQAAYSTTRIEDDKFEILAGVYQNKTTGEPLTAICYNKNVKSEDYQELAAYYRPSHADFTAEARYKGCADPRGGGHFSGRLTAPMVFAGAIAELALAKYGVKIYSHIKKIKDITDQDIAQANQAELESIAKNQLPVIDTAIIPTLYKLFLQYRQAQDSLGGVVETIIKNVRAGIGGTHAQSLESRLCSALFAIPAVKGVEFGLGFGYAEASGKIANDQLAIKDGKVYTLSNNDGGIVGGIANGEDIIFRTVFKSVASIAATQQSVNKTTKEVGTIEIKGRHDVCIVPRTIPIVDSLVALTLLDAYLEAYGYDGF